MIKAVLFDVDDTLLDFSACSEFALKSALSDFGVSFRPEIGEIFLSVTASLWKMIEDGKITREELFARRFDEVFRLAEIALDGKTFEKSFHSVLYDTAIPFDGARDTLSVLSHRVKVCAASNAPADQQKNRLQKAGLLPYFDALFCSEEIGASKPESAFFDRCFDSLFPLEKDEIMMVGDSPDADISGAGRYGFVTCWFNPKMRIYPGVLPPDYEINLLSELKRII